MIAVATRVSFFMESPGVLINKRNAINRNLDACLYPAGHLCEGKINGDAVTRKECHYRGYHFCDRGKPEVFACGAAH
jgi:hypothetical protein